MRYTLTYIVLVYIDRVNTIMLNLLACQLLTNVPQCVNVLWYGRPSTPLFDLLEHRYQERWLQERREAERRQREKIIKKKLQGKVYETRASLMRRYSEPVEPPPLWKMKRWELVSLSLLRMYILYIIISIPVEF